MSVNITDIPTRNDLPLSGAPEETFYRVSGLDPTWRDTIWTYAEGQWFQVAPGPGEQFLVSDSTNPRNNGVYIDYGEWEVDDLGPFEDTLHWLIQPESYPGTVRCTCGWEIEPVMTDSMAKNAYRNHYLFRFEES